MPLPRYPSLYEINTRVLLTEASELLGRPATLDDISDALLDHLANIGIDWIWLLSVWQTGPAGQRIARALPYLRKEYEQTLTDLREEDIAGSGFAITAYTCRGSLGGDEALARLRDRLKGRGLRLMLDFVPNHTATDHPWVQQHPEYYVSGTEKDLARSPENYIRLQTEQGDLILAHGRDPYFPGWTDTLQLNYGNPALQKAMMEELRKIAGQCDGVRCDMAMLVLPEVFERTWGIAIEPFWPKAIQRVRETWPEFCFMAEVYWDLEWTVQQQGFDYAYDKRLYDRLVAENARPVREHFLAGLDYQNKLARFLENHDEPRAAATFPEGMHEAAAVITYLSPGLRFFHDGQFQGEKIRLPTQLVRGPRELPDPRLQTFYEKLLAILRKPLVRNGQWRLLECSPAWDGNWTCDSILAFGWEDASEKLLVAVNYAPGRSQGYIRLAYPDLTSSQWQLRDHLSEAVYNRSGEDLAAKGLYLDVPGWQSQVFSVTKAGC
jgi:hypothetical protein